MFRALVLCFACLFSSLSAYGDPLKNPIVIGASVSAGMHLRELTSLVKSPRSGRLALDLALEKEIDGEIRIPNNANRFLFFATEKISEDQIERALVRAPSSVVAVDFLFWYLHGYFRSNGDVLRMERFERGLAQLDRFDCPIVVGDIPDATPAIGRVLGPGQVPSKEVQAQANARLREWAKARGKVKILPLSYFLEKVVKNEALKIGAQEFASGETYRFIQRDHLHPSQAGVDAIAKVVVSLMKSIED